MSATEKAFDSEPTADDGESMKPMDVAISVDTPGDSAAARDISRASSFAGGKWREWMAAKQKMPRRMKLITSENYRRNSLWSLRYSVLSAAISTK